MTSDGSSGDFSVSRTRFLPFSIPTDWGLSAEDRILFKTDFIDTVSDVSHENVLAIDNPISG